MTLGDGTRTKNLPAIDNVNKIFKPNAYYYMLSELSLLINGNNIMHMNKEPGLSSSCKLWQE